jgi:hypothetical protein
MDDVAARRRAEHRRHFAWTRRLSRTEAAEADDFADEHLTASERLALVDTLMLEALVWRGQYDGGIPRLRRSVARVQRRRR